MATICNNCGFAHNPDDAKFCGQCGAMLVMARKEHPIEVARPIIDTSTEISHIIASLEINAHKRELAANDHLTWIRATSKDTPQSYRDYLRVYENNSWGYRGKHVEEAKSRIIQRKEAKSTKPQKKTSSPHTTIQAKPKEENTHSVSATHLILVIGTVLYIIANIIFGILLVVNTSDGESVIDWILILLGLAFVSYFVYSIIVMPFLEWLDRLFR